MEWTDGIKNLVDDFYEKKKKVDTALTALLEELNAEPNELASTLEPSREQVLSWDITIKHRKVKSISFTITIHEIKNWERDESGYLKNEFPEDIEKVVKQILIWKIEQEIKI